MQITGLKLSEVEIEFTINGTKYAGRAVPVAGQELALEAPAEKRYTRTGLQDLVSRAQLPEVDEASGNGSNGSSNGHKRKYTRAFRAAKAVHVYKKDGRNAPLSSKNRKIAALRASGLKVADISKRLKMTNFQVYSRLGTAKAYAKRNPDAKLTVNW